MSGEDMGGTEGATSTLALESTERETAVEVGVGT